MKTRAQGPKPENHESHYILLLPCPSILSITKFCWFYHLIYCSFIIHTAFWSIIPSCLNYCHYLLGSLLYPLQSFLQKQTVNLMKCTSPLQWLHNNTRVTFRCHAYHSRPGLSQPLLNDTFSPLSTSLLMFLISVCCQLQIGTCHWYFPSTLQGLSHVLLQCWQPLKGVHRGEKKWGTLCSGKIWQNRSSDRHYQKSILWVQFLYLFMSRKALKCFMVMTAPHD